MINKNRPLMVFRFLWDNTDEEHPALITDILNYLEKNGIHSNRKTIAADLRELQDSGFDIVCNRSRQNQYFIGNRGLELAELKSIVDAIQAAKFISSSKSKSLINRLSSFASPFQADQLKRSIYVDGKTKTSNENVYYIVDLLHYAIQNQRAVSFQYLEYTQQKEKILKHNGQKYILSPYDLVWNNDAYYIFGWSEGNNHDKVVKFRVDRMTNAREIMHKYRSKPKDYDIEEFCRQAFSMFDGEEYLVTLRCDNSVMKDVIDKFGEGITVQSFDKITFITEVTVSVSQTFFAWVFAFSGKIRIIGPEKVKQKFLEQIHVFQS